MMHPLVRSAVLLFGFGLVTICTASAVEEKSPPPTIAKLLDRVTGLIRKGDYESLERLGTEWRGRNGRLPLCRDGQSRLMALCAAQQNFSPHNLRNSAPCDRLLEKWKAAQPDSTLCRLMNAVQASQHALYDAKPEAAQQHWQEALDDLALSEKSTGRTADWYFTHVALAYSGQDLLRTRKIKELPATLKDWVAVAEEGIVKFPDHLFIMFRAAGAAERFGYPGGREAFARRVCELLPDRGMGSYARIYWSAEGEFQGDMFAPGNCDWPTFASGFEAILRTSGGGTPWNLNHFLLFARQAGDRATTRRLLATIGDTPDPETFAIEAKYVEIRQWAEDSAPRRKPVWRVEGWSAGGLAWSRDGLRLFVGFYGKGVTILEGATGRELGALNADSKGGETGGIAVSPDGRLIAAVRGSETGRVPGRCTVWDAATGAVRASFDATKGPLRTVTFSPDSKQLLAGGGLLTGPCEVWHWTDGEKAERLTWADSHRHTAVAIAWPRDNSKILFNCGCGYLSVAETGRDVHYVKQVSVAARSNINELSYSPDGKWLAAALIGQGWQKREKAEGCVALFGGGDLQPRADVLAPLTGGLFTVDFSPDGKLIAAGGYDGFAYILDAATLEVKAWWNAEEGVIYKVRWSPNGQRLALTTFSGAVTAWDVP